MRNLPASEQHGLGLLPSDPQKVQAALATAHLMLRARIRLFPPAPAGSTPGPAEATPILLHPADAATMVSIAAAAASLPQIMDWRTRGIIGTVGNQA